MPRICLQIRNFWNETENPTIKDVCKWLCMMFMLVRQQDDELKDSVLQ